VINMFSVALAIFCGISIGLALEKDKKNGR
jgi:hypothetical protein